MKIKKCNGLYLFSLILLFSCASAEKKEGSSKMIEQYDSGLSIGETDEEGVVELVIPEMNEYAEAVEEAERSAKIEQMELGSEEKVNTGSEIKKKDSPLALVIESEFKPELDLRRKKIEDEKPVAPVVAEKKMAPEPAVATGNENYYVVQRKDSLYKISLKLYKDKNRWQEIVSWNKDLFIRDRKLIVGQRLKFYLDNNKSVNGGTPYVIRPGDNLQKISQKRYNGTTKYWPDIWKHNRVLISDPNNIQPGLTIYTPSLSKIKSLREEARGYPYKWEPSSN